MTNEAHVPGSRLRRFAERAFDRETLDCVVLPAIADLQHECGDGVSHFVRLRAYWGLWKAIAFCVLTDAQRHARPTFRSVGTRMSIIFPIVMGAAMLPAVSLALGGANSPAAFLMVSATQVCAAALPVAFFFAVALEHRSVRPRQQLPAVFAMSLACTLVMLTMTSSVLPRANQAYRVSIYERQTGIRNASHVPPAPGTAELTSTELVGRAWTGKPIEGAAAAREALSMRMALSTVPVMIGLVALGISGNTGTGAIFVGVWVVMLYLGAIRGAAGSSFEQPSAASVWWVNSVFALAGLFVAWIRPRPEGPHRRWNMHRA